MTRERSTAFLVCATILCGLATSREAKADWYDDAKDIIEQLVEDDIATQVVPNAARQIPAVCEFFPATVGALEDKRYTGLPAVLRKEAADAIGFIVLTDLATALAAPPGAMPAPLVGPAAVPALTWSATTNVTLSSGAALMKAGTLPGKQPPPAGAAAAGPAPQGTYICSFPSLATSAQFAAWNVAHAKWKAAQAAKPDPTVLPPVAPAPIAPESKATAAMRACIPPQANIAAETECAAALLVRDVAEGSDALLPNDSRRLAAALFFEATGTTLGLPPAKLVPLARDLAGFLAKPSAGAADVASFVCTDALGLPSTPPSPAYAACIASVSSAVAPLLAGLGANVTTLEEAFGAAAAIAATCSADRLCNIVGTVAAGGEEVVTDLQSKDYGAAAGTVIGAVQSVACTDAAGQPAKDVNGNTPAGCTDTDKKVYAFIQALAVYSIDSVTSGSPSASVDADFRTAAVDLIEAASGAGVRRSLLKYEAFLYVPEFSLRDAWIPGHIGTTSSQLLIYPSVELLRGRLRIPVGNLLYLGIHGSLLNPIGPLIEVATRDSALSAAPNVGTVFALGFVVPRIDVEAGIPELSKNLVAGIGGALRFFRAEELPSGIPTYCVWGATCAGSGGSGLTWNNVELSVFVKYVP